MNECLVLPSPGCEVMVVGEALALPGARTTIQATGQQISASAEALMRTVYDALETLVLRAITRRTADDFKSFREKTYGEYCGAVLALPALIKIVIPAQSIDVVVRESFCEMEAEFREKGLGFFGAAVRDQALFTVWTLRKITKMISQIPQAGRGGGDGKKVADLLQKFTSNGIWTRFHLHCLLTSMRSSEPMFPEPLHEIIEGLRAAVNAYSFARQLVDVMAPRHFPAEPAPIWDEEDQELIAQATFDMLPEEV